MNLVPFDSRNLIYKNPFGAVKSGGEVAFRVVLENDNENKKVFIEYNLDGNSSNSKELTIVKEDKQSLVYEIKLSFSLLFKFSCFL